MFSNSIPIFSIIPTTNGYKTMETIEVGDFVFGLDNKPVKPYFPMVISAFPASGKTFAFNQQDKCSFIIADSDSSNFSWTKDGNRNPEFPKNAFVCPGRESTCSACGVCFNKNLKSVIFHQH